MRNSGYLCKDDSFYYILFINEQEDEFRKVNKVLVHVYKDKFLQEPVLNEDKTPKKVLKDMKLLTMIGFLN